MTGYFSRFYEAEYTDFGEEYAATFLETSRKWRRGEHYRITNRTLICCTLEGLDRKPKKALIVEDQFCLVVAEIAEKQGCKIVVNESWKRVALEISKEDATWL